MSSNTLSLSLLIAIASRLLHNTIIVDQHNSLKRRLTTSTLFHPPLLERCALPLTPCLTSTRFLFTIRHAPCPIRPANTPPPALAQQHPSVHPLAALSAPVIPNTAAPLAREASPSTTPSKNSNQHSRSLATQWRI